jgi:pilus assembly protein CpaF
MAENTVGTVDAGAIGDNSFIKPILSEKARDKQMIDLSHEIRDNLLTTTRLAGVSDEQLSTSIRELVHARAEEYSLNISEEANVGKLVFSSIRGFGLLDIIMNDETITEVMINGHKDVFIEQAGRVKRHSEQFGSEEELLDIVQRIVGLSGREVNQANPIVDTRLPDGSRVNVVLPPIALCGPTVTIRKFSKTPMTVEKLIAYGSITKDIAEILKFLVLSKYNMFIAGGTGSGKTTFLNAMSRYIPADERVITCEDSAELQIETVANLVALETRNANSTGTGAVTMTDLIKSCLRMRPERIVVGECRGGETLDMLQAMNTGHDGSLSTGHANSTKDMLSRIETMVLQGAGGLPIEAIRQQIGSAVDIIVHLSRLRDHSRKTMEICEILGYHNGEIVTNPIFKFEEDEKSSLFKVSGNLNRTKNPMKNIEKLVLSGYNPEIINENFGMKTDFSAIGV